MGEKNEVKKSSKNSNHCNNAFTYLKYDEFCKNKNGRI